MTNLLQDPSVLIFDKLFFGLTMGNYDLHVSTESGLLEEFLIIREEYYGKLGFLEKIVKDFLKKSNLIITNDYQTQKFNLNRLKIDFIIYSSLKRKEILGLSLRIRTNDRLALSLLGASSEKRIQKMMFLLSRGLLRSSFHQINQKTIVIELD